MFEIECVAAIEIAIADSGSIQGSLMVRSLTLDNCDHGVVDRTRDEKAARTARSVKRWY